MYTYPHVLVRPARRELIRPSASAACARPRARSGCGRVGPVFPLEVAGVDGLRVVPPYLQRLHAHFRLFPSAKRGFKIERAKAGRSRRSRRSRIRASETKTIFQIIAEYTFIYPSSGYDCSARTTFLRSAFGLLSPARECFRLRSSLAPCASSIVRFSCAAFFTALGTIRDLPPTHR